MAPTAHRIQDVSGCCSKTGFQRILMMETLAFNVNKFQMKVNYNHLNSTIWVLKDGCLVYRERRQASSFLPQDKLPAKVVGMLLIKFAVSNGLESLVMSRSPILSGQLNLDEENNNGETHPAPWCIGWEVCRDMDGYAPWMVHHGPHGRIETVWPILMFQCVPESSQLTWYFWYDYDDGMSWNLPSCPEVSDFKTTIISYTLSLNFTAKNICQQIWNLGSSVIFWVNAKVLILFAVVLCGEIWGVAGRPEWKG